MSDIASNAATLVETYDEHADLNVEQVESQIQKLVDEYTIPVDEATRSVENSICENAGIERSSAPSASSEDTNVDDFNPTPVEEINEEGFWHDIAVEVVQLWTPNSDSMAQVGLLGDETDKIKFTIWQDTEGIPTLEEGQTYHIQNVVADEYEGKYSVKFTPNTQVTVAEDEEIQTQNSETAYSGAIVSINTGSGLIKRCPEDDCTRVLQNGRCAEHGPVDGEFDLRIKAVIDDGETAQDVVFNQEATEAATTVTLEEAKTMAMDALDTTVVANQIRDEILGKYVEIEGPVFGQYLLVNDATFVSEADDDVVDDIEELLSDSTSVYPESTQAETVA